MLNSISAKNGSFHMQSVNEICAGWCMVYEYKAKCSFAASDCINIATKIRRHSATLHIVDRKISNQNRNNFNETIELELFAYVGAYECDALLVDDRWAETNS